MKWKLAAFLAIVIGAIGGSWIKNLPGVVIIAVDKTSYEMRLWVAVTILAALISLMFFIFFLLKSIMSSASKVKSWQGGRQWKKARKQTIKGMMEFVEGRFHQSEVTMVNAAKNSDTKLINYLIAARSAQYQNAENRRDQYLQLADKAEPSARVAIGLTQAQLQLDNQQYEQALATLNDLNSQYVNHPFVAKLLYLTYQKLQDWGASINLLPLLKKLKVYDTSELEQMESTNLNKLLVIEAKKGQLETLHDIWLAQPTSLRRNPINLLNYAQLLIQFNQMTEAEKFLKPLFKKKLVGATLAKLVSLYGDLKSPDIAKQFNFLESWHASQNDLPVEIYLSLGKIAYNASLWGKARFYFDKNLKSSPSSIGYLMLAKTQTKMEENKQSEKNYRLGLHFATQASYQTEPLSPEKGADDLVSANLLPKLEIRSSS